MATLKWKNDDTWETFCYGAFENIKADLRNIIIAINNSAAGIRRRCCRDKNLSDLYSAEIARKNLGLIGDCSDESKMGISPHYHDCYHLVRKKNLSDVYDTAESRTNIELINDCSALPKAPHHHDSRYIPLIEKEASDRKAEDARLKGIIDGLEGRINSLSECFCTNEPDEPTPTPTPTPTPNRTWGFVGHHGSFVKFIMPSGFSRALIAVQDSHGHANIYVVPIKSPGAEYILENSSMTTVALHPTSRGANGDEIASGSNTKWGPMLMFGEWVEKEHAQNGSFNFGRTPYDRDDMGPGGWIGKHIKWSLLNPEGGITITGTDDEDRDYSDHPGVPFGQ